MSANGYVFGLYAYRRDGKLTDTETELLGKLGRQFILEVEEQTGITLSGQWGPWREGEPYPLRSMSTSHPKDC